MHEAAYYGNVGGLRNAWEEASWKDRVARDTQGNTCLHVAVFREQEEVVDVRVPAARDSHRRA